MLPEMLSKGALIVKPIVFGNVGKLVVGRQQIVTGRLDSSSRNELHRGHTEKFDKTTMKLSVIELGNLDKIGDGKIFVTSLSGAVRIRTGERDEKALI